MYTPRIHPYTHYRLYTNIKMKHKTKSLKYIIPRKYIIYSCRKEKKIYKNKVTTSLSLNYYFQNINLSLSI